MMIWSTGGEAKHAVRLVHRPFDDWNLGAFVYDPHNSLGVRQKICMDEKQYRNRGGNVMFTLRKYTEHLLVGSTLYMRGDRHQNTQVPGIVYLVRELVHNNEFQYKRNWQITNNQNYIYWNLKTCFYIFVDLDKPFYSRISKEF